MEKDSLSRNQVVPWFSESNLSSNRDVLELIEDCIAQVRCISRVDNRVIGDNQDTSSCSELNLSLEVSLLEAMFVP